MSGDLQIAFAQGLIASARVGADLAVLTREGALSAWLPPPGANACDCALLFGMEQEFAALRANSRAILTLPGMHADEMGEGIRANIAIVWDAAAQNFLVLTMADRGAGDIEALLTVERRSKQMADERAEAATRLAAEREARYRNIVEAGDDLVLRLDEQGQAVFANAAAQRMTSLDIANPEWRRALERAAASLDAEFEQSLDAPTGETRRYLWTIKWLGGEGGAPEFQAVGHDITALHRLREETERANAQTRVSAAAQERLRIARDLHDTLLQSMAAVLGQIRLSVKLQQADPVRAAREIAEAELAARTGIEQARAALGEIRAPPGGGPTLGAAIRAQLERLRERLDIRVDLHMDPEADDLRGDIALGLTRVCEEALRNVERHARARTVGIDLSIKRGAQAMACLSIADDGAGFDLRSAHPGHYGIAGMHEQAELLGGALTIDSRPGAGARIELRAPLPAGERASP